MKLLIADDHALIRAGLRSELATLDDAVEFFEAWDVDTLREMCRVHRDLDLAVVDLTMPGMERERTIAELREIQPALPIVVLSGGDPVADATAVLRSGAAGFIPKSGMSNVMLQAIRLVLAGGQYLPPQLMQLASLREVPNAASLARKSSALDRLSERQREVFALLAEGLSNKGIARRLDISEGTVKTHVATIFDLLNVHNRVSAVAAARALAERKRPVDER